MYGYFSDLPRQFLCEIGILTNVKLPYVYLLKNNTQFYMIMGPGMELFLVSSPEQKVSL